jgi:4-hydroxy-tetrahydrodipicolinate reductase
MSEQKNLALIGYGKMGKMIAGLAPEYGFDPVVKLGVKNRSDLVQPVFREIDVAIEFTTPEAAPENLKKLAALGVRTVTGTTGWLAHLEDVSKAFREKDGSLVWSPNFSVGVAVFRKLVEMAGKLFNNEAEYGAWAWEIHHDTKLDAPSGTLINLVKSMESAGYSRKIDVSSNRAGKHPGTHEIGFDSAADTITLRHTARSREGFARGALKAARWILDHKGVFTFDEVLFGSDRI